jgi:thiosulfate/3-mercaptopyruvate sulfurtransferase
VGINDDTILILYGDFNNWFAAAFWVFKCYGYKDIRLMNGRRKKWLEEDSPLSKDAPSNLPEGNFKASTPDENIRVFLDEVKKALDQKDKVKMVDVRSPKEFTGEILAPPEYPTEHAQRGGHIPGAENIPWAQAVKEDGTIQVQGRTRSDVQE